MQDHPGTQKLDADVRRRFETWRDPLPPARHPAAARHRAYLVTRLRAARQNIAQLLIDCEYWNAEVRQPHEPPFDPDPYGDLRVLAAYYDRLLIHDTQ
jgi:hypothetical protein